MKKFVCIVCPNSCELTINEETLEVSGNKCKRGEEFAISEITHPMRSISSTVKTIFKDTPVVPVRVSSEIPKDKIFDVMAKINKAVIRERIGKGEVVIKNVCDLNVDVITTSDVLKENK